MCPPSADRPLISPKPPISPSALSPGHPQEVPLRQVFNVETASTGIVFSGNLLKAFGIQKKGEGNSRFKVRRGLSQQRAQVVVDYLRAQGIQQNIVAEGKGFYLPLSGIDPADPQQQRTEIRLVRVS